MMTRHLLEQNTADDAEEDEENDNIHFEDGY